jgi:hypothetical protein
MARIRVQQLAESNLCQPDVEMLKMSKKKKRVRGAKPLAVFAGLACTSPSKKCDKQLTHIVRVMLRRLFYSFKVVKETVSIAIP